MTRRNPFRLPEKPVEGFVHGYSLSTWPPIRWLDRLAEGPERLLLWPWTRRIEIDRPIFIVGAFRSGTTILERIVAAHPAVGHFWFLTNVYSHSPATGCVLARLLQRLGVLDRGSVPIAHNPHIPTAMFSPFECEWIWSRSSRSLWDKHCTNLTVGAAHSDPRFERTLSSLIRRHLLVQRAARFVNKNPINCLRLGYLRRLFPTALFVYIVRDPLDTIWSHQRMAERVESIVRGAGVERLAGEGLHMPTLAARIKTPTYAQTLALDREHPLLGIANQWRDMNAAVLDMLPGLADQALLLRYEELVAQPAAVLERMWVFVELADDHAAAITHAYVPRLTPPPPPGLRPEERHLRPRVRKIIAPVADRLGYR
ncbi:MAG: sulfotransferase [Anaerolineae bacterium]|nr:sulfotransferase [Anaerolineae bacterium]